MERNGFSFPHVVKHGGNRLLMSHCSSMVLYLFRSGCAGAGDLAFLVDASGSIGKTNFRVMTDFVAQIIENLDVDSALSGSLTEGFRVAMLTYSSTVDVFFMFNTQFNSKEALLRESSVPYLEGTTDTASAIK